MKPIEFAESNCIRTAPEGHPEVQPLPTYTDGRVCISKWRGSWKERVIFALTGELWLSVMSGSTLPPVLVTAEDVFKASATPVRSARGFLLRLFKIGAALFFVASLAHAQPVVKRTEICNTAHNVAAVGTVCIPAQDTAANPVGYITLADIGLRSLPAATVINCTSPVRCNNANSSALNAPTTISITTSAFVSSGRQLFTPAPLLCDGSASCDLSADRTLSIQTCAPHAIMAGPTSGVSPGLACVSALGNTIINQTFNSDTAYTSTRATDTTPTGNFQLFKSAAGSALWQVDISGSLAAGIVPFARVTGFTLAHSSLTGLSADDHAQYALLAGRSGGQSLTCGTAASDGCTIATTSNGTKGKLTVDGTAFAVDGTNLRAGVGTASPAQDFNVTKIVSGVVESRVTNASSNAAAQAVTRSQADVASGQMSCYSSAFSTALFGVSSPSSYCLYGITAGSGIFYGATVSAPVIFGTNNVTRFTIPATNNHLTGSGTAPTITCTGAGSGSSAACVGIDMGYTCTITTGTAPANNGTCTVTYNAAMDTNKEPTVCMLVDGASAWGIESVIHQSAESLTAPVFTWVNVVSLTATALTASSNYKFHCLTAPWK